MMLRAGAILLSIWSGLNLLVGAAVTAMTLGGGRPPALSMLFSAAEIGRLDGRVLAVVNAQAAFANPCIVALCVMVLVTTWTGLRAGARWAFWALAGALVPLQAFGFVSDGFLGHHNIAANVVSTVVLVAGLSLSGYAVQRQHATVERSPGEHRPAR